jgi:hypothetical protein
MDFTCSLLIIFAARCPARTCPMIQAAGRLFGCPRPGQKKMSQQPSQPFKFSRSAFCIAAYKKPMASG